MSYTFLDQQNKLSSLCGDPNSSTDDMFPLAIRKKELNRGELHFAVDSLDIREYATGTVASSKIDLPADWVANAYLIVDNVVITNDREISLADWEKYYNWAGTPPYFYIWEVSGTKSIFFIGSGVDGSTYKLFYYKKPTTELSGNTDISLHNDEYREAPVYYAAGQLLRQIGKEQEASIYLQTYDSLAQRAKAITDKSSVNKEYARPDMTGVIESGTDTQGSGYTG
jgi:hypothetical protein